MKRILTILLLSLAATTFTYACGQTREKKASAQTTSRNASASKVASDKGNDYQIVSDVTENGVRHICAKPSSMVCPSQIDFDIVDGKIHNLKYKGGCNGNLKAIGRLLEGMSAQEAAKTLEGVDCGGRGTSCTDQLARILKKVNAK